jgi:hypothetical protein
MHTYEGKMKKKAWDEAIKRSASMQKLIAAIEEKEKGRQ